MNTLVKKLFSFALLFLLVSARAEETNFFPVMAWNHVPPDLAVLQEMKECGFTVAGFVTPGSLKLCRKAGLKAIVSDPRVSGYDWTKVNAQTARRNVTSLVKEIRREKQMVYGYYLRDEPGADLFAGLETVAALVRELAPGAWPYINLLPNYADAPSQLNAATYEDYLAKFCGVCQPMILSYDHYALMDDGSLRDGYWKNLEQMRSAALAHALPFWNIVLSVAHFNYREPAAADLRFEVYSSLACGARGLAYFTYFTPPYGNYRMAPLDPFGHRTATWNYLQSVNLQIASLGPTLLQLTSDDVYHINHVPAGCHAPQERDLIAGMEGGDFMAGDFTQRDGSRYVMIVNKSLTHSAPCYPHYRKTPQRVRFVSPFSGELEDYDGEACWLAPGAGVLLKLE